MKKQIKFVFLSVACVSGLIIGALPYVKQPTVVELTLDDVEAQTSLSEWWNRKDYDCVPVTCECLLYNYQSDVAKRVDDGCGEVAHTWNCTGCGNCGWL